MQIQLLLNPSGCKCCAHIVYCFPWPSVLRSIFSRWTIWPVAPSSTPFAFAQNAAHHLSVENRQRSRSAAEISTLWRNKNHNLKCTNNTREKTKVMKNQPFHTIDWLVINIHKVIVVLFKTKLVLWSANISYKWNNCSSKSYKNWCQIWAKYKNLPK